MREVATWRVEGHNIHVDGLPVPKSGYCYLFTCEHPTTKEKTVIISLTPSYGTKVKIKIVENSFLVEDVPDRYLKALKCNEGTFKKVGEEPAFMFVPDLSRRTNKGAA